MTNLGTEHTAEAGQEGTAGNTVVTVADVRRAMDAAYPPALAESWDRVGLICGDPRDEVSRIALALDCTDEVVDRAVASGVQMLVVHHPLLLRGVSSVATDTPKGRIIHKLIREGIALFAAHTNADSARPGVNDQLATVLGVTPGAPLAAQPAPKLDSWTVKVPASHVDAVAEAMFAAGAGSIGDYEQCSFQSNGRGQFRPLAGATPFLGEQGRIELVDEVRLELVAPRSQRESIVAALKAAHPYEEPAFDIVDNQATGLDPEHAVGIGRVGTLDTPMPFKDFVARVAERLPTTEWGVRGAGDPERIIRTVAVASGAGDSFLDTVAGLGVDAFVTSDLRHHPVDETLRAADFCVVDTAHWASEFPWCHQAAKMLSEKLGIDTEVLAVRTDPWTVAATGDRTEASGTAKF